MKIQLVFKKGKNYSVDSTHEIDGFLISYHAILNNDVPLEETNVKSFLKRIKRVADELSIKKVTFFIDFIYDVGGAACCVDEQKIVHLTLPITVKGNKILIDNRGIDEDYLLYHELMHAKAVLDGRFPSSGRIKYSDLKENLIGRLEDFANEGLLETMGLPHLSKETTIENLYNCFLEDFNFGDIPGDIMSLLTKEKLAELCEKVWGKELTYSEAEKIIDELLGK